MANFSGKARSNYFRVKDAAAFQEWVNAFPGMVVQSKGDAFMVYSNDPDTGCFPSSYLNEADEDVDIDLPSEIGAHLVDGEVCILMQAGSEKLCYISGWAMAFDSTGKVVRVSLDDIYSTAKEAFGVTPTEAVY